MNRGLRIALFTLGGLALLAVLAIGALFIPAVQRAVAVAALEGREHTRAQIEHLNINFSGAEIRGLRLEQPGQVVRMDRAILDFSLLSAIFRREIIVTHAVTEGLVVDLSAPEPWPRPEPEPIDPQELIRMLADLDYKLRINGVQIRGQLLLAGQPPADFFVLANGIAPGATGVVEFSLILPESEPDAPLTRATSEGRLEIVQARPGIEAARLNSRSELHAGPFLLATSLSGTVRFEPVEGKRGAAADLRAFLHLQESETEPSDLRLQIQATPIPGGADFTALVASEHLLMPSFTGLAARLQTLTGEPPPPATPSARRDPRPIWTGLTGSMRIDLRQLTIGPEYAIEDVSGEIVVQSHRIALEPALTGSAQGGLLEVHGEIVFTEDRPDPYLMTGSFRLDDFRPEAVLRALNPELDPVIEGLFAFQGAVEVAAPNLTGVLRRAQGNLTITSSGGTLYPLANIADAGPLGPGVPDLLGRAAERLLGRTEGTGVSGLIDSIRELTFGSAQITATLSPEGDIILDTLEAVGPDIRLLGRGGVGYQAELPWMRQPVRIELLVAGRGATEELLRQLGLGTDRRDELGYLVGPTVDISGTLSGVDSNIPELLAGGLQQRIESFGERILPGLLPRR